MLELKDICKTYHVGDVATVALDHINVAFREKEFVAILGTSGSGKTTCLNMIGGLDRYDSGEMTIKGKKTTEFKERDWDAYRNNSIGFIFQSYNLIMHLSIVENVELGMTLSGVSRGEKRKRALEVLEQVGLKNHIHKKPNQLSGGQMQRVAIARALANDPEILLCDEPTGALDSATSVAIMDLIKEVAKDKLVIMVTHNPELAEQYADRIIRFQDGKIIDDSHPHKERPKENQFHLKKTAMKYRTALGLSLNNLRTKKGRTFLTAFASSIGIIGIAVILSLSSGFKDKVLQYQEDTMADMPVLVSRNAVSMDEETMKKITEKTKKSGTDAYAESDKVYLFSPQDYNTMHANEITTDYLDYIQKMDSKYCESIGYSRITNFNVLKEADGKVSAVSFADARNQGQVSGNESGDMTLGLYSYPTQLDKKQTSYLEQNYDCVAGSYPKSATDVVLVVDEKNRVEEDTMKNLGFETKKDGSIPYDKIVGTKMKIVPNDVYYQKNSRGLFLPNEDQKAMYQNQDDITVQICAVVRKKEDVKIGALSTGIAYSDALVQMVIDQNQNSEIVKEQKKQSYNVMTMQNFESDESKDMFLSYLGADDIPYMISIYPDTFAHKDQVLSYLDAYNDGKEEKDKIVYTDMAGTISEMSSGIMDGITIVLVAFAAISLVVSLIMICIITYTSVLERTKEIGVLKALGARKKDITRVFDAETCILGVFSGVLGIVIAYLLTIPINAILFKLTELEGVAVLQPKQAIALIIISTVLTMIGGHIPARMASKKDAVIALRSE